MKKIATVNMEQYNEDEVGVSVWACPIYGGGRVVWCGPCLCLRVGVPSYVGGGVVGSAEGREEVVTHQLTAQTVRALNRWCMCVCVYVCVCTCASTNVTNECRFESGAHG